MNDAMTTLDRFYRGDIRALSRIISYIENKGDNYRQLLGKLYEKSGRSIRIGITGPPGAGKSTLVNCLIHEYLTLGKSVGVVAVDPTSPFTGGALLGDRVRMADFPTDGTVYFRSMATRGATGGLSDSTGNVTVVLDAFGFDITLIETVGVGQVELDVIDACDTIVVAIVPESGDGVQAMKAGLMEIADIFVINKADRPGADRLKMDVRYMLESKKSRQGDWNIPVLLTEGISRKGIDKLFGKIQEHIALIRQNGIFETHRRNQIQKRILSILRNRFQREFIEHLEERVEFSKIIDEIYLHKNDPFKVSDELYREFQANSR